MDKTIHPLDIEILAAEPDSFKTEQPPPAFVGDIECAPVIVLCSHGGWKPETPDEFLQRDNSPDEYVRRLHNSTACNPKIISPYYARGNLAQFLDQGKVAILNLIPYRSPMSSKELKSRHFESRLPSSQFAVQWVNEVAMPQVKARARRVILKHNMYREGNGLTVAAP